MGEEAGAAEMAGVGGAVITGVEVGEEDEGVISVGVGEVVEGVTSEVEAEVAAAADSVVRRKTLDLETCLASTSELCWISTNIDVEIPRLSHDFVRLSGTGMGALGGGVVLGEG